MPRPFSPYCLHRLQIFIPGGWLGVSPCLLTKKNRFSLRKTCCFRSWPVCMWWAKDPPSLLPDIFPLKITPVCWAMAAGGLHLVSKLIVTFINYRKELETLNCQMPKIQRGRQRKRKDSCIYYLSYQKQNGRDSLWVKSEWSVCSLGRNPAPTRARGSLLTLLEALHFVSKAFYKSS